MGLPTACSATSQPRSIRPVWPCRALARFSGLTRLSYTGDLAVFAAERGQLELRARSTEEGGLARSTIGRRWSTWRGSTGSR